MIYDFNDFRQIWPIQQAASFQDGDIVLDQRFGKGMVVGPSFTGRKILVRFESGLEWVYRTQLEMVSRRKAILIFEN